MVGDRDQPLDVLVDHQDRLAGRLQRGEASPDLLTHQRREPLGRLVEDEQVRIGHERPADGEHLLLAAREPAAEVVHALGEPGEEHQHLGERPRVGRCAAVSSERDQVLPHAQVGEDLASLGNQRDTAARDAVGALPLDALAAEADGSAPRRGETHDRAHRRRLSHAVAPEQRRHFAGADREVDAEQHLARSVGGFEFFHLEQLAHTTESSPRYAFLTSGWARIAAGAPLAIKRPETSTEMRSARRHTATKSCSTSSTVMRAPMRLRSAIMFSDSSGPMPAIGSSRSTSRGWVASARPTSSARCSPCASVAATAASCSASPISRAIARASSKSSASFETGRQKEKLEPLPAWTASARLSSTVKRLNRLVI